jgi:predicted lipoprotein with Yx(FWY)xxD motif
MAMMRTRIPILLGGVLFALALAACSNGPSGSGYGGGNTAAGGPGTQGGSSAATVKVTKGSLGPMLVDAQGRTLYVFSSDATGTSTCYGDCATTWPALTTKGAPKAGSGLMAGALGTMARTDGSTQVTIDGHPVYTFSGDTAPGDTNGEGFGGLWFVASPSGAPLKPGGSADGSTGGNGSGNGGGSTHYGY